MSASHEVDFLIPVSVSSRASPCNKRLLQTEARLPLRNAQSALLAVVVAYVGAKSYKIRHSWLQRNVRKVRRRAVDLSVNPMAAVGPLPVAEIPDLPTPPAQVKIVSPSFTPYESRLLEVQGARERLQEVVATSRQLANLAIAKAHRSDLEGARAALAAIRAQPSLQEVLGPGLWDVPESRLRVCEICGLSSFLELFIGASGLLVFFEAGALVPEVPETWRVQVSGIDDETYLMGLLFAVKELERYAVNRGQFLDVRSVRLCLGVGASLEQALMQFNFRNSDLRQKFDGVKYAVKKFENLAYEIDLARQRSALQNSEGSAAPAQEVVAPHSGQDSTLTAFDLNLVGEIKLRYDQLDEQREEVIKRSRDVAKAAKNAIYSLQRSDFKRAEAELARCTEDANAIYEGSKQWPSLRLGFFSGTMEEFAEALSYRAFLKERRILSLEEMQAVSGLKFPLLLVEYLGGLLDLTGEVGRLAVRSASKGREAQETIQECLACVESVYEGIQSLPFLPRGLEKKMSPLKWTLVKMEQILYELALLSQGRTTFLVSEPDEFEGKPGKGAA